MSPQLAVSGLKGRWISEICKQIELNAINDHLKEKLIFLPGDSTQVELLLSKVPKKYFYSILILKFKLSLFCFVFSSLNEIFLCPWSYLGLFTFLT